MSFELYQKDLLKLAARATGAGRLAEPDASARVDNPLCGDRITVDLTLDGDTIKELGHDVKACVLCQATASVLGAVAPGRSVNEVAAIAAAVRAMLGDADAAVPDAPWQDFAAFLPARDFKSRHGCVLMPFDAIAEAVVENAA